MWINKWIWCRLHESAHHFTFQFNILSWIFFPPFWIQANNRQVITTSQIFALIKCWSKYKATVQSSPTQCDYSNDTICYRLHSYIQHEILFFKKSNFTRIRYDVTKCQWNVVRFGVRLVFQKQFMQIVFFESTISSCVHARVCVCLKKPYQNWL